MNKIIYRKKDLQCVGTLCANITPEQEVKLNVIPNFGGIVEDYSYIETDKINFHLEKKDEKILIVENKITPISNAKIQTTKEEKLLLENQQLSKQVNNLLIENKLINKMLAQQINSINIKLNNRGDL